MAYLVAVAAVYFLLIWYHWAHSLPQQRLIVGCQHKLGRIVPSVPDKLGRMTALVWRCRDCPFQVPLKLYRRGKLWYHDNPDERADDEHPDSATRR